MKWMDRMSYFKSRIAEGMCDPEYREGRAEAILELIHFSVQPSDVVFPFSSAGVDVHIHAPEISLGAQSVVPPTIGIGLKEAVAG